MPFKSEFLHRLESRGLIHQCTDAEGLDELCTGRRITGYIGFDATAPSLHIGNLVSIMLLRHLQQTGHRVIALTGGGTTKVGDPTFRDESRPILSEAEIEENKKGIEKSIRKFVQYSDDSALFLDNADWLDELRYIPFLRDFGRHFTVNRMLSFDSVRLRMEREQPLTLLEFNYMVMQAYDYLELNERYDCVLQMGGSDQWGNIVNGIDLTRRVNSAQLYGLTTPLITTSSGAKMGKSASGAVWLNEDRLAVYDYWQFWRNTEDADVGRFLKIFTDLPLVEIHKLENLEGAELNEAKVILATEATALCHGREQALAAQDAAKSVFQSGSGIDGLPVIEADFAKNGSSVPVIELFIAAGFAKSNGDARRLIRGGGARLSDEVIRDEMSTIDHSLLCGQGIKVSAGKKRHALVRQQ